MKKDYKLTTRVICDNCLKTIPIKYAISQDSVYAIVTS